MTDSQEALLPCPFCGSTNVDEDFWMSQDKHGPGCMECSATADSNEAWNKRAALPVGEEEKVTSDIVEFISRNPYHDACKPMVRAALSASRRAGELPREPTVEMLRAGTEALKRAEVTKTPCTEVWLAMYDACTAARDRGVL